MMKSIGDTLLGVLGVDVVINRIFKNRILHDQVSKETILTLMFIQKSSMIFKILQKLHFLTHPKEALFLSKKMAGFSCYFCII